MTSSTPKSTPITQAVVAGGLDDDTALTGHVGASEFPIGGPDGRGGLASGPNPYDLLSASLAACTAMTIRLHARHKKYPLSHVEVASRTTTRRRAAVAPSSAQSHCRAVWMTTSARSCCGARTCAPSARHWDLAQRYIRPQMDGGHRR
jgi:organic hydroperoxide reductase OsmC/OhrA